MGAGQVNCRWAVWLKVFPGNYRDIFAVVRYNVRSQHRQRITLNGHDPAVSSDGTVYFLRGWDLVRDLVRVGVGGTETVVAQLSAQVSGYPSDLFVKDRSDGSHVIFYETKVIRGSFDIYKIVDK